MLVNLGQEEIDAGRHVLLFKIMLLWIGARGFGIRTIEACVRPFVLVERRFSAFVLFLYEFEQFHWCRVSPSEAPIFLTLGSESW